MKTTGTLLFLLLIALLPATTTAALREAREVHYQMGTYLEVTVWHDEPETAKRLIRDAVREVHRLDEILSNYDPDSALSHLNRRAGAGVMRVPAELFALLTAAREFSEKTGGIFDVTVGPLMELWQRAAANNRLPSEKQVAQTLATVGYRNLALRRPDEVELARSGMSVDLGGIGKGYAVDRVTEIFRIAGVTAALINFGSSSMSAIGAPPGKHDWEIAVQDTDNRLRGAIHLRDAALSTSSSMGRWWTIGGKKYGHLIHPMSGAPITEARTAIVISRSATQAEALTKPLVLLGKSALPTIEKFPRAQAVVLPASGAPAFSRQFSSRSSWKEISQQ
ncbi:MAG TPA: FAD:protein FMN transferase [Candidatus Binatia bacterium]